MHEKLFPNDFWVGPPQGAPREPTFFCRPLQKTLKSVFHQELNRKGPRVHGGHNSTKKMANILSKFSTPKNSNKIGFGIWHELDTWYDLFGLCLIHLTQSTWGWGHTTNFSPIGPVIWQLTGGCGMPTLPTQVGLRIDFPRSSWVHL